MTLNYERHNAIKNTREFLYDIMVGEYGTDPKLLKEARRCLKHFPGNYDMELAREQAPEVFGDWEYYKEK